MVIVTRQSRLNKQLIGLLVLSAVAAAVVPTPDRIVEQAYSTRMYPAIQALLTTISNGIPMALDDALVVLAMAGWIGAVATDLFRRRLGWRRAAGRCVVRTAALAAVFFLSFLLLWGLNYRRVPLADKLQ